MTYTTFAGSITTSGTSEAIRLEKRLFTSHPEFRQRAKVKAAVIAPGQVLISVVDESPASIEEETDPLVDAFLGFLAADISKSPGHLSSFPKKAILQGSKLTKGVVVTDEDVIPDDITF